MGPTSLARAFFDTASSLLPNAKRAWTMTTDCARTIPRTAGARNVPTPKVTGVETRVATFETRCENVGGRAQGRVAPKTARMRLHAATMRDVASRKTSMLACRLLDCQQTGHTTSRQPATWQNRKTAATAPRQLPGKTSGATGKPVDGRHIHPAKQSATHARPPPTLEAANWHTPRD